MRVNKKVLISIMIAVLVIILAIVLFAGNGTSGTIKCVRSNQIIKDFNSTEVLKIKLSSNKVSGIVLDKEVTLNGVYSETPDAINTYSVSLEKSYDAAYRYLDKGEYKLTKDKNIIKINIDTKKNGVILDNLSVIANDDDKLSLRFEIDSLLENSKTAIKINDLYSRSKLKQKLTKLGYKC